MDASLSINSMLPDANVYRRADPAFHGLQQPWKCDKCGGLGGIWAQRAFKYVRLHRRHHFIRAQGVSCDESEPTSGWDRRWPRVQNTELVHLTPEDPDLQSALSTPRRECNVCGDDKLEDEFPALITLTCTHGGTTCFACMHNWIHAQLEADMPAIPCPVPDCNQHMDANDIQRQSTEAVYLRYLDQALKRHLASDPDFRWCRGCDSGQLINPQAREFYCEECNAKFCLAHDPMAAHPNETCGQYEDRQRFLKQQTADGFDGEKESAAELKRMNTKRCPSAGCGVLIENNGGCNHMRCRRCGHDFCWVCMQPSTATHYAC